MIGNEDRTASGIGLMQERKDFNCPPYSRIIEITIRDRFEDRAVRESAELSGRLGGMFEITGPYSPAVDKVADQFIRTIRINLKKDRRLSENKKAICEAIQKFEKERRYDGHIIVNVDPS